MKSILLSLFVLVSLTSFTQHVFYGERTRDNTDLALYFDNNGFPYPDWLIPDSTMEKAYGSLTTWFLQNNEEFIAISAKYELFPERIDTTTVYQLRDSINAVNLRRINTAAKDYGSVTFYIHGFRKAFTMQNGDVTSVEEFRLLRGNLVANGSPPTLEIEVYWDGMYDCCFSAKRRRNKELYELFEKAGNYAYNTGIGLRRVLSKVSSDSIAIVAHSLGCKVAAAALFDLRSSNVPTPQHLSVRTVFIAPAVSGSELISNYERRDNPGKKNYHFLIIYNENDFVLRKKDPKLGVFGPGVNRYGCTSLGCNSGDDAEKLAAVLNGAHGADIRLADLSRLGKYHSLRAYTRGDYLAVAARFLNGDH
jgi:hypothetical protein